MFRSIELKYCRYLVSSILMFAVAISGTQNAYAGKHKWAMDKVAKKCAVSIVGGAILGGLLGAATGKRNIGRGVAVGAVAGGATCFVMAALSKAEKKRIQQMEFEAAETMQVQELSYRDGQGRSKQIVVVPEEAPPPKPKKQKVVAASKKIIERAIETKKKKKARTTPNVESDTQDLAKSTYEPICRYTHAQVSVDGTIADDIPAEHICRDRDGNWAPA